MLTQKLLQARSKGEHTDSQRSTTNQFKHKLELSAASTQHQVQKSDHIDPKLIQNRPKINPKSIPGQPKIDPKSVSEATLPLACDFGRFVGRFNFRNFRRPAHLGSFWGSSWGQTGAMLAQRSTLRRSRRAFRNDTEV